MNKAIVGTLVLIIVYITGYTTYLIVDNQNVIVIGTKNFTEQEIIAYVLKDVIEDQTDYEVKVLPGIGETSFLQAAMLKGDIDIYVDYTSTAYQSVLGYEYNGETNQEIFDIVDNQYQEQFAENWISLLGFENTNAILCSDFCTENNITKLSQLKDYDDLTFAAPVQFFTRSDGLPLMESTYGINISPENQITLDHGLIYTAISNNEVDLALGYTTDGELYQNNVTVLEDDLNCFAKYDAGIIVSDEALAQYPDLEPILKSFEQSISLEEMQKLNYEVDIKGDDPDQVAKNVVEEQKNSE